MKHMRSTFEVACIVTPKHDRPWFLLETWHTSDGPRTRICNGRYKTIREAYQELELRTNAMEARENNDV